MAKDISRIEKFNGDGFHSWQTQVKYLLMFKGLWLYVNGKKTPNANKDDEVEDDERAQAMIMFTIDKSLIHHIDKLATATLKWEEMEKSYGAKARNSKIALKFEFFGLEFTQGDLGTFISHMKGLMAQLSSIKSKFDEEDVVAILLKVVTKFHPNLVTTFKNVPDPTFEGVISSLLDEDKRTKATGTTISSSTSSTKFDGEVFYAKNTTLKCSYCKKRGHIEVKCFKKNPMLIKCGTCGENGHFSRQCTSSLETLF